MRFIYLLLYLGFMLAFGCNSAERKQPKFEDYLTRYAAQYGVSFTIELIHEKGIDWDKCINVPLTESFTSLTSEDGLEKLLTALESLSYFTKILTSPYGKVIHLIRDEIGIDDAVYTLNLAYDHFYFEGFTSEVGKELHLRTPSVSLIVIVLTDYKSQGYSPHIPIKLTFENVTIRDILSYCMPIQNRPLLWVSITTARENKQNMYYLFKAPWRANSPKVDKSLYTMKLDDTTKIKDFWPEKAKVEDSPPQDEALQLDHPDNLQHQEILPEKSISTDTTAKYFYAITVVLLILAFIIKFAFYKKTNKIDKIKIKDVT